MARTTLNSTDIATLRALVENDANTLAFRQAGDDGSIAAYLNTDDPTPTKAWDVAANPQTIDEATPWVNFDNITQQGKRDSYLHAFFRYSRDFSRSAVRKWITDVWGTAADAQAILTAGVVNASRAQAAIGGTVRTTATIAALDRNYVGKVQPNDVAAMRGAGW